MNLNKRQILRGFLVLLSIVLCLVPGLAPAGVSVGMAVITGGRSNPATTGTATGAIDSSSRVIDMSDTIHLLDPNEAPLTAVTMKLRKAHCISPKIEWLEDDYLPSTISLAATVSTTVTAVVFSSATAAAAIRKGDILQNMTNGENIYVSAVSSDSATVARAIGGGTNTGTVATADVLLVVGNANEEGATTRTIKSTTKTNLSNFTQIFRWPFGLTGTLNQSEVYGGSDLNYQTRKAGIEHRISMERSFLFGRKSDDVTLGGLGLSAANGPLRFCDGVLARVTTNVTAAPNPLTQPSFETFLATGMRYGPARKVFFASRLTMSVLNNLAVAKIVTVPTTSSFPLAITEYVSPHGKIYLVTHNLLTGGTAGTYRYQGYGLLLDMDSIFYRYLQGRDTTLRTNIQANDADARTDEYLTEAAPMVIQEKNHSILNTVIA